jgi:peptidyl-prolyl cis-trans isomerase A (cyclophilin A)
MAARLAEPVAKESLSRMTANRPNRYSEVHGGIAMRRCSLSALVLWGIVLLAATPGCGDSDAPTASIESEASEETGSGSQSEAQRERAARRQADLFPIVEITTTAGTFKLKLDRAKAERTVDNFLSYVSSGFYQGTVFHQVEKGFVVAAGGYNEAMEPKRTGVSIRNEAHNGLKNVKGAVAMVRSPDAPNSATSQFMINLADNAFLNHQSREIPENGADKYGYCVFGEVVEGWDVVEQIANSSVKSTAVRIARPQAPAAQTAANGAGNSLLTETAPVESAPEFDEVTFDALPTRPIVIQSARRVK